jgi:rhamnogalacturonyl hydrolase YesR
MCLYLDRLQLDNGLFNHAADVPMRWGRGNGWMAAAMPMILQYLKSEDKHYSRVHAGYLRMMETLLETQRPDGLWGQLVDDPSSWGETSATAMFAYSFIMGVKHGWLDAARYAPAARKAYLAVCGKMDTLGNVADVCCGTGARNDRQYYYDRRKINGDPHGQAPMLWCVNLLLEWPPRAESAP